MSRFDTGFRVQNAGASLLGSLTDSLVEVISRVYILRAGTMTPAYVWHEGARLLVSRPGHEK